MTGEKRVLVADDNPGMLECYRDYLNAFNPNIPVDMVDNGAAFLEKARSGIYALAFTDNDMPRMTGVEAVRAVRQLRLPEDLPIYVVSSNDDIMEMAMQAGATGFMDKITLGRETLFPLFERYLC